MLPVQPQFSLDVLIILCLLQLHSQILFSSGFMPHLVHRMISNHWKGAAIHSFRLFLLFSYLYYTASIYSFTPDLQN